MKTTLTPEEQFVLEVSHAYAKLGTIITNTKSLDEDSRNLFILLQFENLLQRNLQQIVSNIEEQSKQ